MVECFSVDGKKFIAVANPSVNDYLSANILKRSSAEWKSIASSVVTIQQVVRLNVTNKERDRLIASFGRNETILDLIYESEEQKSFFVALSVIMTGELKQAYAEHIRQCFKSSRCDCPGWRFSFQWQNRESICEKVVMDKRLREFYLPGKQLAQYVNELLFNCSRYDMVRLLESFCSLSKDLYDPNDPVNKKAIESAIDAMIDDYAGDRWEKISSFASKDDYEPERIAEIINQDILDDLMYRAPDSKSVPDFICNYYDEQINSREYCTEDEVEEELKRLEDEPEESFDDFYSYSGPDSIAEMFERPSLK